MSHKENIERFRKMGGSAFLCKVLEEDIAFNRGRLASELEALAPKARKAAAPKERPATAHDAEWKPLYKLAVRRHSMLDRPDISAAERKEAALEILDLFDKIHRIWWLKENALPVDEPPVEHTPLEVARKITNLRANASKAKKKGDTEKETEIRTEISKLEGWLSLKSQT